MYSHSKEEQRPPHFPLLGLLLLAHRCNFPGFTPSYTHRMLTHTHLTKGAHGSVPVLPE